MDSDTTLIAHIKNELFTNLDRLSNEIDLSFDFIDRSVINKVYEYIENIKQSDDLFSTFIKNTCVHLKTFESNISFALFSKQKYKSDKLDFLNRVKLFDEGGTFVLDFAIFHKENKNTKKSLIQYLYNIYMSSHFFYVTNNDGDITKELSDFIGNIQSDISSAESRKQRKEDVDTSQRQIPQPSGLEGMSGGMGDMMSSILGNKEILNIANEISQQMKDENINPMTMISSLMSGKPNNQIEKLVGRIQQNVENKISTGEINKEHFEEQAKSIFESVNKTNLDGIPGLSGMLGNLMKEMGQ